MRRTHLEELERIQRRVNALFEEALLETGLVPDEERASPPGTWSPPVDVVEAEDAFHLYAELPGLRREDIELRLEERRLILTGHRPPEEGRSFVRMERSYGPFRRSFELPEAVDPAKVEAKYERGVLSIKVGKRGPASGARRVDVREGR